MKKFRNLCIKILQVGSSFSKFSCPNYWIRSKRFSSWNAQVFSVFRFHNFRSSKSCNFWSSDFPECKAIDWEHKEYNCLDPFYGRFPGLRRRWVCVLVSKIIIIRALLRIPSAHHFQKLFVSFVHENFLILKTFIFRVLEQLNCNLTSSVRKIVYSLRLRGNWRGI